MGLTAAALSLPTSTTAHRDGAALARPSMKKKSKASRCRVMVEASRCFVMRSAGCLAAKDLRDGELLRHDPLLDPEVLDLRVAQLAKSVPRGDADRGTGVAVHATLQEVAEVVRHRHEA